MSTARVGLVAALLGVCVILSGCGKKESAGGTTDNATAPKTASGAKSDAAGPAGAPTAASGRLIEITGNDSMKFSINEIRAKPGETLSVTLVNIGTMPKFSMGHNWILLKAADRIEKFIAEAATAPTTDYIPKSRSDDMIAHTKLLGPKESDTVTFQAPKSAGRYPFLCSFPGHYQVGMKGELIVE